MALAPALIMEPTPKVMQIMWPSMEAYLVLALLFALLCGCFAAGCWSFYCCCSPKRAMKTTYKSFYETQLKPHMKLYQLAHNKEFHRLLLEFEAAQGSLAISAGFTGLFLNAGEQFVAGGHRGRFRSFPIRAEDALPRSCHN